MWPALKRQIEADSIAKGLMEQNLRSQKIVEKIEGLPKLSIARALILEPKRYPSVAHGVTDSAITNSMIGLHQFSSTGLLT
jgi:hypothetical protein